MYLTKQNSLPENIFEINDWSNNSGRSVHRQNKNRKTGIIAKVILNYFHTKFQN